jgi:predicted nucleic acid-binding protein
MPGVAFDSTILIDVLNPKLTGDRRAALDELVQVLGKARARILVPAPCFTELLIRAGKAKDEYSRLLGNGTAFEIIPFDLRAATECALLLERAWDKSSKRAVTRTKFKFDWMIVACAVSRNADRIYSDDADIRRLASEVGLKVVSQNELPVPSASRQLNLPED